MTNNLAPQKALIFRIVHRDNLTWILQNGVHCRNSAERDPNYISIGNPELIGKRHERHVPVRPGGTLSDYVPFYFTPWSPMLFNITTGWGGIRKRSNDEIVILASSLHKLKERQVPFLFADRHAYLATAQYFDDLSELDQIDWAILQQRDFKRDSNDVDKVERYQAEALVYRHLPVDALLGIACYDSAVESVLKTQIEREGLNIKLVTRRNWYF